MNQLIEKKSELNNNFNELLSILNNIDLKDNSITDELNNKNKILHLSNTKLIDEIKEKDKIISMNQKTICDYEKQINSFNQEQEQSNKFDMVKAKDKEVHEQNKTIVNLKKEIDSLKNKLELASDKNISCDVEDTPVVDEDNSDETPVEDTSVENEDTPVEDTPVENEDTPVEDDKNSDEEDSDEQLEVETIIWYKKEYYMYEEDGKKKVFEITDDEDIGKEIGLWVDKKLVRHDKKKK
jgi:hypothetical protein